ncbi:MAG: von Willebrand factor type A domain-containing protein [Pseudomonadota bacterium]
MTDPDLHRLSSLETPKPPADARAAAVARGVAAFNAGQQAEARPAAVQGEASIWQRGLAGLRAIAPTVMRPSPAIVSLAVVAVAVPLALSLIGAESESTPDPITPTAAPQPPLARSDTERAPRMANVEQAAPPPKAAVAAPSDAGASRELRTRSEIRPRAAEQKRKRQSAALSAGEPQGQRALTRQRPKTAKRRRALGSAPTPFISTKRQPAAVVSMEGDGDTSAYRAMRRAVQAGAVPSPETGNPDAFLAVFARGTAAETSPERNPSVRITVTPTPWNAATRLAHVTVKPGAAANGRNARLSFNPDAVASWRRLALAGRTPRRSSAVAVFELTPAMPQVGSSRRSAISSVTVTRDAATRDAAQAAPGQPSVTQSSPATFNDASEDVRFSIAAIAFARKLQGGEDLAALSYAAIANLAFDARGDDRAGLRGEFVGLVRLTGAQARQSGDSPPRSSRAPSSRTVPRSGAGAQ